MWCRQGCGSFWARLRNIANFPGKNVVSAKVFCTSMNTPACNALSTSFKISRGSSNKDFLFASSWVWFGNGDQKYFYKKRSACFLGNLLKLALFLRFTVHVCKKVLSGHTLTLDYTRGRRLKSSKKEWVFFWLDPLWPPWPFCLGPNGVQHAGSSIGRPKQKHNICFGLARMQRQILGSCNPFFFQSKR